MNGCAEHGALLAAFLDGELEGTEREVFERHLAACATCRRALEEERAVLDAVQRTAGVSAPPELRGRVEDLLDGRDRRRWWAVAALAAALVAAAVSALVQSRPAPDAGAGSARTSSLATFAADTHLRHARRQLPLEVVSDRPETVAAWFDGRVPFALTLPQYPSPQDGKVYRLEGGRLVSFHDQYAAFLAYRMDGRPITLVITTEGVVRPEGGEVVPFGALSFHVESASGLKVITWSDNRLTYALTSALPVGGAQSCLVCHGSAEERARFERFATPGL